MMTYHQNLRPYPTIFKTESTREIIKVLTLQHFCSWKLQLSYTTMEPQCQSVLKGMKDRTLPCFQFFVWWVSQILWNLVQATTVGVPLPRGRTDLTITSNDEISSKHKALSSNIQNWKHKRKHQSTHFATPQLWYNFLGGWQIWPSHPMMKYHQNIRP